MATMSRLEDEAQPIIRTMHPVDPAAMSPAQARLVWRHLHQVTECTPTSRMADLFGQPLGRYWLTCPSDSHPAVTYDLRVRWTDQGVSAGHYGRLCPAAKVGRICWHLQAAVLRIAVGFYDGKVPVAAAEPLNAAAVASPPPPDTRPVTVGGSWWE